MSKTRVPLDLPGLSGHEEIFRLPGAATRGAAVETWLSSDSSELRALARTWFSHIRGRGTDVRELMHDGGPAACVKDAAFAQINAFKSHVNVAFFHGATLDDPAGLLQGSGKRMRHVKLVPGQVIDESALKKLIAAAYVDIKARLDDDMI